MLFRSLGRPARIDPLGEQPGDVRITCADISHARAELGYDPRVPIEEGIRRFAAWLKDEGRRA